MSIKGTEIRTNCVNKVDASVISVLEILAEENAVQRQQMQSMADLINRCIENVMMMVKVNDRFKAAISAAGISLEDVNASAEIAGKDSMVQSEEMKDDDRRN